MRWMPSAKALMRCWHPLYLALPPKGWQRQAIQPSMVQRVSVGFRASAYHRGWVQMDYPLGFNWWVQRLQRNDYWLWGNGAKRPSIFGRRQHY